MLPGNVTPASQMMSWEMEKKKHLKIARMSCPSAGDSVNGIKMETKAVKLCSGDPSTWKDKCSVSYFLDYGEFSADENKFSLVSIHTGIYNQMPVMHINWVQTHMLN